MPMAAVRLLHLPGVHQYMAYRKGIGESSFQIGRIDELIAPLPPPSAQVLSLSRALPFLGVQATLLGAGRAGHPAAHSVLRS